MRQANPLICWKIAKYSISESIILYPNGAAKAQNIPKYPPGYPRGPYGGTFPRRGKASDFDFDNVDLSGTNLGTCDRSCSPGSSKIKIRTSSWHKPCIKIIELYAMTKSEFWFSMIWLRKNKHNVQDPDSVPPVYMQNGRILKWPYLSKKFWMALVLFVIFMLLSRPFVCAHFQGL